MEMDQDMEQQMEQENIQDAELELGPRQGLKLSSQMKNHIVQFLQQQCQAGALPHGSFQEAANRFKVHRITVSRLWGIAKQQMSDGQPVIMRGRASGYKKKTGKVMKSSNNCLFLRDLAIESLHVKWVLARQQLPALDEGKLLYHAMHNTVHIDEKWFYMTKASDRYYLPQFGTDGQTIFDGKIGIFPFTEQVPAKRKSKNRPRGTLETKSIPSVNKETMRECLLNQIIPTIKAKCPANACKSIDYILYVFKGCNFANQSLQTIKGVARFTKKQQIQRHHS
ncbi:uncharacterized protein LOC121778997 [Salvia splendens]|uniref:uncharacterized protein LOC121778997 n=1 Tax=Salvia splendens TaxID=180675 RepID=UPI001C27B196|nr:uncharacterized protein LOC121778997 [Salvia splendens]